MVFTEIKASRASLQPSSNRWMISWAFVSLSVLAILGTREGISQRFLPMRSSNSVKPVGSFFVFIIVNRTRGSASTQPFCWQSTKKCRACTNTRSRYRACKFLENTLSVWVFAPSSAHTLIRTVLMVTSTLHHKVRCQLQHPPR